MLTAADDLASALVQLARAHRDTVMIGRTHGVHAEPTTFGAKVALWALQVDRERTRLRAARDSIAVMKLSGAVGTYSNIPPEVETFVGEALGLRPIAATQVVARDRHAEFLYACASIGATCELVAVELRHLQRTEVREVQEGFKAGQKGSSAMRGAPEGATATSTAVTTMVRRRSSAGAGRSSKRTSWRSASRTRRPRGGWLGSCSGSSRIRRPPKRSSNWRRDDSSRTSCMSDVGSRRCSDRGGSIRTR
jgi:adenylosuccinate lyase